MIRAMVVDDSPLVRKIAADILNSDGEISVVATAATAEFALQKLEREKPDVITMDIEMPGMGGLAAIQEIMHRRPTPIIVLSAHAQRGAELTLQALEAGAMDFVAKPAASLSGGIDSVARELIQKIKASAAVPHGRQVPAPKDEPSALDDGAVERPPAFPASADRWALMAIGTSTGGPVALRELLAALPASFPLPVAVVQHMPPVFTRAFADRLNECCALRVKEAEEGDELRAGSVLIAPGNFHMTVERNGVGAAIHLDQSPAVSGHRPSVDVLIQSVAREYGAESIALIMRGMGKDGAAGLKSLHRQGGFVIAQDKESSAIFGMNREAIAAGSVDLVLPLSHIATRLVEMTAMLQLSK